MEIKKISMIEETLDKLKTGEIDNDEAKIILIEHFVKDSFYRIAANIVKKIIYNDVDLESEIRSYTYKISDEKHRQYYNHLHSLFLNVLNRLDLYPLGTEEKMKKSINIIDVLSHLCPKCGYSEWSDVMCRVCGEKRNF